MAENYSSRKKCYSGSDFSGVDAGKKSVSCTNSGNKKSETSDRKYSGRIHSWFVQADSSVIQDDQQEPDNEAPDSDKVTECTDTYKGFLLDNVLHSSEEGDIHYNVYIPDSYDGSKPYALFFTLPGYEGLYFQGVGVNIKAEEFGFAAQEYFLSAYNIDKSKVYAEGYSGGGETMSLVMGMRPDLYTAYLQCSSQWDGAYEPVVQAKTPVYFVVGAHDEYYGSEPSEDAYNNLRELYQQEGLSDEEIDDLLVLDVKDDSYFSDQGVTNQHGQGGGLFVEDDVVMGWLLGK